MLTITVEAAFDDAMVELNEAAIAVDDLLAAIAENPAAVPLSKTELRRIKMAASACRADALIFEQMRARGRERRRKNPGVKGATS